MQVRADVAGQSRRSFARSGSGARSTTTVVWARVPLASVFLIVLDGHQAQILSASLAEGW